MDNEIRTTAEAAEDAALPRCHEVHGDPDTPALTSRSAPAGMTRTPQSEKSPAQWAYERIIMYLKHFEDSLDNEHEVAMGFTGGDAGIMRIEGMGYFDPDIVTFYGSDPAGGKTQAIQHVTQMNVMLRALPKAVERKEPNRIGFRLAQDIENA